MSTPPEEPGTPNPYQPPAYAGPEFSGYELQSGWNQPQQRPQGTNGFAIAALVCGLLSCSVVLIVLAVIFGCVALSQIKKTGQAGRGLAIGGLVAAGVWVAGIVVLVVLLVSNGTVGDIGTAISKSSSTVDGFRLKPGDCFDREVDSNSATVTTKPCTAAHDAEAFAVIRMNEPTYPDADRREITGSRCSAAKVSYLDPDLNYPGLSIHYLYPVESAWNRGTRVLVCFFRGDNGPLTGPARPTGVHYTDLQKRFVQTMDAPDLAFETFDDVPTPTWADRKVFATAEAARVQGEITALTASPWQDGVQPSVDALVAKLRTQLPHWQDAASAGDSAGTSAALDEVSSTPAETERSKVRVALGLRG